MNGFFKKYLVIDLTTKTTETFPLEDSLLRDYLGGKGLATKLLLEHNPRGVDPLGPENCLIFATGPVSGTPVWGSCRYGIYTKSPQTGFYTESYSGGTVGDYMSRTGFDALVIKGASRDPVWLEIFDGGVRFHSAKDLWGLDTYWTEDEVKKRIQEQNPDNPKSGVVVIGPA